MSEVLFSFMANGREKGKERFLCPVSPCWHTQAQMAAKISQQQRRQPKAVGRLLGLQARGQKWELWVVNVHFEKGEIGKRGNPWFWGCGVTWSQVVMASEWQLGAICQQELNDTTSAPEGAGEGHWPVGEGKSTLTSSLVCEWLRLFFPFKPNKKGSPRNLHYAKWAPLYEYSPDVSHIFTLFRNFFLKIFVSLLSNPWNSSN